MKCTSCGKGERLYQYEGTGHYLCTSCFIKRKEAEEQGMVVKRRN